MNDTVGIGIAYAGIGCAFAVIANKTDDPFYFLIALIWAASCRRRHLEGIAVTEYCSQCGQAVPHLGPRARPRQSPNVGPVHLPGSSQARVPEAGLPAVACPTCPDDPRERHHRGAGSHHGHAVRQRLHARQRADRPPGWVYLPGDTRPTSSGTDAAVVRLTDRARDELSKDAVA